MRKSLFLVLLGLLINIGVKATPDEGMWLPMFLERLNYVDMQKEGLKLTPEELYSINHSSLKDAIIGLSNGGSPQGYFCTGELISGQGLVLTNHHCGFDAIQKHSSVEHDYLEDGFWAMNHEEELPNEGLTASFLVRMEDVTTKVLAEVTEDMDIDARKASIKKVKKELETTASEDGRYEVIVKSFFSGNEYYMFIYNTYKDVRLVGAPPSNIGKFGGDTDNWMWPRHTGDFSMFRIYAAADGTPAEYSKENEPLTPKHHLPVSLKGVQKNDFAMIWGYPGGTQRYLTSYGVNYSIESFNPTLVEIWGTKLEIWKKFMDQDKTINIQYASKYAGTANGWKMFIGQTRGLKRMHVYDKKQALENQFTQWVNENDTRKEKYGHALSDIETGYNNLNGAMKPLFYGNLGLVRSIEMLGITQQFGGLARLLGEKKKDEESIKAMTAGLQDALNEHFKNYNAQVDEAVAAAMLKLFAERIPEDQQPEIFAHISKKYDNNFEKYAADLFEKSMFDNKEAIEEFLANPKLKKLEKDPAYIIVDMMNEFIMNSYGGYAQGNEQVGDAKHLFVGGLMKMLPAKKFYPNANSTMRMTYGQVLDYEPADAVYYNYFTTMEGIMEKEDPTNTEFIVAQKLKELYAKKDYGRYADKDGKLHVAFLTNNDITGGNSGSPVINGNGELIGVAFDGNWEAMSGDIAFEDKVQRTICADIRYVLFVIDKFAGAKHLVDEMTIVD